MKKILGFGLALALLLSACAPPASETPIPGETPSAAPAIPARTPSPGPSVYTDWSQLAPYEKPERPQAKFTRRYEGFTDTLIPAEDYGPLIPFPGATMTRSAEESWGWMDDYSLYGLMTLEGEVVVDPVFSSAYAPSFWDERAKQRRDLDCLVLTKVILGENGEPMDVSALCAADGSWCTEFDYSYDWDAMMDWDSEEVVPLRRRGDGANSSSCQELVFLDVRTGEERKVIDLSKVLERWSGAAWSLIYNLRYDERYAIFSGEKAHYLFDAETGEVRCLEELLDSEIDAPYAAAFSEGLCPVKVASGWGYIDGRGNWVTDPVYEEAGEFEDGRALVRDVDEEGGYALIDHSGKVVYTFPQGAQNVAHYTELWSYEADDGVRWVTRYLTPELEEFSFPEDFSEYARNKDAASYRGYGWFAQNIAPSATQWDGVALWNYKTGSRHDFLYEELFDLQGDYAILKDFAGWGCTLADLNTGETIPLGQWSNIFFERDPLTGETYLQLSGNADFEGAEWRRLNGDTLYRTSSGNGWQITLYGNKALDAWNEEAVTLTDTATGELLFSWPLRPMGD